VLITSVARPRLAPAAAHLGVNRVMRTDEMIPDRDENMANSVAPSGFFNCERDISLDKRSRQRRARGALIQ